ncbi:hypothetical protein H206_05639 [Candidatus Electrothrix aarhusensis]|uniref:Uncharacterized protein n=1 Tax=Candidatus Electrothrix aarhusensis TaxID=1859131 RepID=A0A444J3Y7_9BACT|nr:hypothetical protein H206_05639 [Candidatus Electrothrix aarhusensis]
MTSENGYRMKDCYVSKKLNIKIRRIQIAGRSYTVRPSFVMPYMTAFTDDAEKALFLTKFDVPAWGIARIFGKNGPYWYRMAGSLGRFKSCRNNRQRFHEIASAYSRR